ncbi:unnamed protein product [Rotaria socialis]|uniref:Sialidase domain-containing protein n=1 Tax=Rotaria socialis TaxID=392032 RepID=A0A817TMW4_9BILA|nr:unnamed protein product [Rotaria socialis]CAF3602560.1 unnamed protein product [Rotaria socialis]CAF4372035.1 unnamed protein product [Rotaria socialis]CAF4449614.1 unnamed protein product [Rotaria socialis]
MRRITLFCLIVRWAICINSIPFDGVIRPTGDGSSYAFLKPPKEGNHAAFIEQLTPSGTLAVAWFTGGEGSPNCSIALSLLAVGSEQFTPGVIVSQRVNYSNQNPVLFWNPRTQILHLYHSSQLGDGPESSSELWHLQSQDSGATWSNASSFYSMPGAFDRNRIIPTLDDKGVIFPCYNSSPTYDYSFVLRSTSDDSTWTYINMTNSVDLIQPSIVRLYNSTKLRSFFRDEDAKSIYYSDSNDDGFTWTIPEQTTLPNNNAGIHANILKTGAVIMVFNNHNGTHLPRTPLTVALSYDNGMTWPYQRNIQVHDDGNSTSVGEYSYPGILQSFWTGRDDNDIHLVFTYDRQTIKYVRFNENWIKRS